MSKLVGRVAPGRVLLAMLCVCISGVLVGGCGSASSSSSAADNGGSGSNSSSSGSASSGSGNATGSSASASSKHVTVAMFLVQTATPFFTTATWGGEDAAAQAGNVKLIADGPAQATVTGSTTFAENMETANNPDGFALDPALAAAFTSLFPRFYNEVPGHNVLAWQSNYISGPNQTSPPGATTYVGPNQVGDPAYDMMAAAIKAAHLSPSSTGTALLGESISIPIFNARINGFKRALKQLAPNVKPVVFTTANDQSPNTAAWSSEFAKEAGAHVVLAVGVSDDDTQSLLLLKTRNVGGDWAAAAYEPDAVSEAQGIADGKFVVGVTENAFVEGNVTTALLVDAARTGKPLPKGWINTGDTLITKANATQYAAALRSPAGAKAFFGPIAEGILNNLPAHTKAMAASEEP